MWISLNVTVNFCFTLQHKKMTGGRVGEADSLGAASKYLLKGGGECKGWEKGDYRCNPNSRTVGEFTRTY